MKARWATILVIAVCLGAIAFLVGFFATRVSKPVGPSGLVLKCAGNLKRIHIALRMYADDSQGFLPAKLTALKDKRYLDDPSCLRCPESGDKNDAQPGEGGGCGADYILAVPGQRLASLRADDIMVTETDSYHATWTNVLYADGRVKSIPVGEPPANK